MAIETTAYSTMVRDLIGDELRRASREFAFDYTARRFRKWLTARDIMCAANQIDHRLEGVQSMANRKSDSGDKIRKRTPLEQAIAEKTDRRARYSARMRQAGFKQTSFWVLEERLEEVKAFVRKVNDGQPQEPKS